MKKVHIIFLLATALLPFTTRATEQTDLSDPILVDSLRTISRHCNSTEAPQFE